MIQGFYFSATGILTNSYRQDVIANNIANSETVGFKKDLAMFQQRPTEAHSGGNPSASNRMMERLGGGVFAAPTAMDTAQGDLETTDNNLDFGIMGSGYFQVSDHGKTSLTRDGRFRIDHDGQLAMAAGAGGKVLDAGGRPIQFDPATPVGQITIDEQGNVRQGKGKLVARVSLVEPTDPTKLHKSGGNLVDAGDSTLKPAVGTIHSYQVERSNVEPTSELAQLMDAQRQLEANANMIRYQDSTLARLVNDVGKIS